MENKQKIQNEMGTKKNIKQNFKGNFIITVKDYLLIILGSFITAASINIFLVPNKIAPGGVTGVATVIYYLINEKLPVGIIMLILNVPLFVCGMKYIGGRFTVRTLFSTVFLSVIVDICEPVTNKIISALSLESITSGPDYMLYSIFGGFFMGVGLGIVFRSGATTGGTDLAAKILHKFIPGISIGNLLLIIDTMVILFAAVAFNSFLLALYAVLALFISSKFIDTIVEGINFAKAVYIISDLSDEISKKIMSELDRGVTALHGTGMYTGREKRVLYCIIHRGQLPALKKLVMEIDPSAFVILCDVTEVLGEGFKTYE